MSNTSKLTEKPITSSLLTEDYIILIQNGSIKRILVSQILDNTSSTGNLDNLPWSGKTFAAFGTSITANCDDYNGGYLEKIKTLCGFSSYRNLGVSGAPMTNNTTNGNGINYTIKNTTITEDLILIECCTNDFKLDVPRGNIYTTEIDTFSGALKDAIEHILTNYPDKSIVIICDPQRSKDGYDTEFINSAGYKLIDYVDMAIRIGSMYGAPVADLYRNSGITALTLAQYTTDGLHQNDAGYEKMGISSSGVINSMHGAILPEQIIDNYVLIGTDWYDISEYKGMDYKLIVLINGTYYMYQSHYPIFVHENGSGYSETFVVDYTTRSSASDKVFGNATTLKISGVTNVDDLYYYMNNVRTMDQFICANHDIKIWGTDTVILRKTSCTFSDGDEVSY